MANSELPQRASLEYLKKLAKERLRELRSTDPDARLATALLQLARDHGFNSWRALKAEVERRQATDTSDFFAACANNDVALLRGLIASDQDLVRAQDPKAHYRGWTGLHEAARNGHLDSVRLLLERGADPNAREAGDTTYPLHWAAANRHLDTVRALLDAGGDPHGFGDDHELDAVGWATYFHPNGGKPGDHPEVAALLVERGARHHIFSAMCIGDLDLIRRLVEENPHMLDRRMSRFEGRLTALHFAMSRKRYDMLDLLLELGADLEAEDHSGYTALATAMLHGDEEAMKRLHAAGAKPPAIPASGFDADIGTMAKSVAKGVPMICAPDVAKTLDWYARLGFTEITRYAGDGEVNFGMVSFGKAELMLNKYGKPAADGVSLWFYTNQVDQLYQLMKARQMEAAQATLTGETDDFGGIEIVEEINDTFYGAREFGIRDLNGYTLYFIQPMAG